MNMTRVRKQTSFYTLEETSSKKVQKLSDVIVDNEVCRDLRPLQNIVPLENLLVWSYFKHHGWWPGRIADREELDGPLDPPDDPTRWIRWFGDNKFSEVEVNKMASFHEFSRYFCQAKFNRTSKYRLAVIESLQEASKRAGKRFNDVEKAIEWAIEDFLPGGYSKIFPAIPQDVKETMEQFRPNKIVNTRNSANEDHAIQSDLAKRRNKAVRHIQNKLLKIEDICLRCGSQIIDIEHPIFKGGLCSPCKGEYLDAILSTMGTSTVCIICARNNDVVYCGKEGCEKCFCLECIMVLAGKNFRHKLKKGWTCFLCAKQHIQGLLLRRKNWMDNLEECMADTTIYIPIRDNLLKAKKRKLRVLSLFDGISVGLLALKALKFDVECYYAAEIDQNAISISSANHPEIIHVGDVCNINNKQLLEWGPFDLLLGGSPCNDLAIVNPKRKGIWSEEGTGTLFFEFFRIMNSCSIMAAESQRPFFWLFENVFRMDIKTKETISRYLQVNPVLLDAAKLSAACRPRLFWGNLPNMTRPLTACASDKLTLQECLEHGRVALVNKLGTITTNCDTVSNKAVQERHLVLDSTHKRKDILWLSEIERAFGFPDHYTDKSNISCTVRRSVLGRTWSVPVIRHLLEPLHGYYLP